MIYPLLPPTSTTEGLAPCLHQTQALTISHVVLHLLCGDLLSSDGRDEELVLSGTGLSRHLCRLGVVVPADLNGTLGGLQGGLCGLLGRGLSRGLEWSRPVILLYTYTHTHNNNNNNKIVVIVITNNSNSNSSSSNINNNDNNNEIVVVVIIIK